MVGLNACSGGRLDILHKDLWCAFATTLAKLEGVNEDLRELRQIGSKKKNCRFREELSNKLRIKIFRDRWQNLIISKLRYLPRKICQGSNWAFWASDEFGLNMKVVRQVKI